MALKKRNPNTPERTAPLQPLEYNGKILLAWGEAISGHAEIRNWLMANGYPELGIFCFALRNKEDARKWLMENGYAHLQAMINGSEGNITAIHWLENKGFSILAKMALVGDGHQEALEWLISNGHRDFAVIATRIRQVKDEIEMDNNDIHKISKE